MEISKNIIFGKATTDCDHSIQNALEGLPCMNAKDKKFTLEELMYIVYNNSKDKLEEADSKCIKAEYHNKILKYLTIAIILLLALIFGRIAIGMPRFNSIFMGVDTLLCIVCIILASKECNAYIFIDHGTLALMNVATEFATTADFLHSLGLLDVPDDLSEEAYTDLVTEYSRRLLNKIADSKLRTLKSYDLLFYNTDDTNKEYKYTY
jgi:hypothetical protein